MAAGAFGRARNYGATGAWVICKSEYRAARLWRGIDFDVVLFPRRDKKIMIMYLKVLNRSRAN